MATDNVTILDKIWANGTNDFQQRIPKPTQQTLESTMEALFDPMNRNLYNQFVDALVMRIGDTYVHQQSFKNPLAVFKGSKMMYGSTLQEIATKWVKAHAYRDDVEDVFKMHRPESAVWYHSQNRRDQYEVTVNQLELRTAFTQPNGLNNYVASIMQTPINSDEYDEYRIMLQLFAMYEQNFGFFKHKLSGAPTDEATGKEFLKAVKTYAGKLQFPTTVYNGVRLEDLPVFVKPQELVLFVTPEINASIDVDTLAVLFHLEPAQLQVRKVIVDQFPFADDSCVALLTTEDFFQCRDTVYQTDSIYNPKALGTNYFLSHFGIYSVSPFVPAIMFTTSDGTGVTTITQTVTGIDITVDPSEVEAGSTAQITAKLKGTLSDETTPLVLAPDSATYELAITGSDGTGKNSTKTYVDEYAVLHTAKTLKSGDTIKITGTATYTNPSGATTEQTGTATVTIK